MGTVQVPRRGKRRSPRPLVRPTLAAKVAFLRDPRNHADGSTHIDVRETHFSWLFLTRRYVYKLKKPLRQSTMDYRSLEARERGCRTELRLNRRLAPSVYLAVVPLSSDSAGVLYLGRRKRVVDWLVKMLRLPAERMLDRLLTERTVSNAQLERLARMLAGFFARAQPDPMSPEAYVRRFRRQILANRRDLDDTVARGSYGALAREVMELQLEWLAVGHRALGGRGSRVVEGHGDLRPEHVCLGPPACVIDCLEFDRKLRLVDPFEEIAFLALESGRLGGKETSTKLLGFCREAMEDDIDEALVHFYMSHRASTRAKLAAWHLHDTQFTALRPWIERTHAYLEDARRHCERALDLAGNREWRPRATTLASIRW